MSERSGGRERSEQSGASERMSGASGRASGPVLTSVFLAVIDHSVTHLSARKGVERDTSVKEPKKRKSEEAGKRPESPRYHIGLVEK